MFIMCRYWYWLNHITPVNKPFPFFSERNMAKLPGIAKICLVTIVAAITLMDGIVCPFPPEDPRSFWNPLIVPWWPYAPLRVRQGLHQAVLGEPLPPNDLENLPPVCPRCPRLPRLRPFRFSRPRPFRRPSPFRTRPRRHDPPPRPQKRPLRH